MTAAMVKMARVAFTLVLMNYAAVAGLLALGRAHEVWQSPAEHDRP